MAGKKLRLVQSNLLMSEAPYFVRAKIALLGLIAAVA